MSELNECSQKNTPYFSLDGREFVCKCVKVYDGDTITVALEPFDSCGFYKFRTRLAGIDTPEIRTKNSDEKVQGNLVRDFLRGLILDKIIKIKCGEFDKYGRLLADVYEMTDGVAAKTSLNQQLIEKKYAYAYDGGTKRIWGAEVPELNLS
jgi:endonuclease YncB( thermonuclease family)